MPDKVEVSQSPKPKPKTTPKPEPDNKNEWRLTWLKELVTAALGIAIVTVTLWLLVSMFFAIETGQDTAEEIAAVQRASEQRQGVLSTALGLVGVVTGYFFGRVPVERRAQVAEQTVATQATAVETATSRRDEATRAATVATQAVNAAEGKLADVKATVDRMMAGPKSATLGAGGGTPVDLELIALKDRMGW